MRWIKASIGLAAFGFINLVLFIAISAPFSSVLHAMSDEAGKLDEYEYNYSSGQGEKTGRTLNNSNFQHFYGMIRMIFGLTFVFSMFGSIVWFFLGTHEEEYEQA